MGRNEHGFQDVWVSNSDGYVGQLCVVGLSPEPDLGSANAIANSTIRCICAVPVAKSVEWAKEGETSETERIIALQGHVHAYVFGEASSTHCNDRSREGRAGEPRANVCRLPYDT